MSEAQAGRPDQQSAPILRSFRSRNYRLFFAGQSFSLVGTWMQHVAMSWLVYRLTGSALLLGVLGFVSMIPTLVVAPFAGALADRWDRRRLLISTQGLAMVQAIILTVLVILGIIEVWEIILLTLVLGIVNSFDVPIRQAFVVEMVESREDLANAIALNSSMFHGTRLIGPSLAGLLIGTVGEGGCFLINALSYLAVICSLMAMKIAPRPAGYTGRRIIQEMRDGFSYAFSFAPIRSILLLIAIISIVGFPYVVLFPVFAKEILLGGPHTYGFLMTATGLGSFAAAMYLASRRSVGGLEKLMVWTPVIFGTSLVAFAFSRSLALSLCTLVFSGFGMMFLVGASNTIIQTVVDDDKRGRVMSLYTMAFMGISPFGALLAGALAGSIGATATVAVGGVFCILTSALSALGLPALRRSTASRSRKTGTLPVEPEEIE
ncbi:MAG TPA: MFS transporter [Deltaproteobacteria bacterium]|jgi:MFS family permease|nr:MFS transporter [Deltaproteobacteria bacterium]